MLFKGITTSLAAVAIAFASFSATPAKADFDDAAKIIAGVAALAIIGAAISDSRNDKRHVTRHRGYNHHYGKRHYNRHYGKAYHHRYHRGHQHWHRHHGHRAYRY